MLATLGELALGRLGRGECRRIDAQVPVCIEILAQRCEVLRRPGAVEDLQARDRAHAQLAVVEQLGAASHPGRLVEQDQRHALSPTSASASTSAEARSSPMR